MGKRTNDPLKRRPAARKYRDVVWVSAEGRTEQDYFRMSAFASSGAAVRFPKDIHPSRRNPAAVLKRFEKALRGEDFRKGDEAWLVVDVDEWGEGELAELERWAAADGRRRVAVSNPKFEVFLVMHFEKADGCTTAKAVDSRLSRLMPGYAKRIPAGRFGRAEVTKAIERAEEKRRPSRGGFPAPGSTDAHLLAKRLLREEG